MTLFWAGLSLWLILQVLCFPVAAWYQYRYEAMERVIHDEKTYPRPIDMDYYAGWSNFYSRRQQLFSEDIPVTLLIVGFGCGVIAFLVWLASRLLTGAV